MPRTSKLIALLSALLTLAFMSHTAFASDTNLPAIDVSGEVNTRTFLVGDNQETGALMYVVDRTTGLCFASLRIARAMGSGLGLTQIECKRLAKIPSIARFMKTGRVR